MRTKARVKERFRNAVRAYGQPAKFVVLYDAALDGIVLQPEGRPLTGHYRDTAFPIGRLVVVNWEKGDYLPEVLEPWQGYRLLESQDGDEGVGV